MTAFCVSGTWMSSVQYIVIAKKRRKLIRQSLNVSLKSLPLIAKNRGTNAIKIKGRNDNGGKEKPRSTPDRIASMQLFFIIQKKLIRLSQLE